MQLEGLVPLAGGVPVTPLSILEAEEAHDQMTRAKMEPRMAKVEGLNCDGDVVGTFSGFIVGPSVLRASTSAHHGLIVTAGHALHFSSPGASMPPAERFRVKYTDGSVEDVRIIVPPPASNVPDLMLLEGSRSVPLMQADAASFNSNVYALGYDALQQLACNRGSVASTKAGAVSITAHADNGFSGGPVVDLKGQLVGIIKAELGVTIKAVGITPAYDLQTVLCGECRPPWPANRLVACRCRRCQHAPLAAWNRCGA